MLLDGKGAHRVADNIMHQDLDEVYIASQCRKKGFAHIICCWMGSGIITRNVSLSSLLQFFMINFMDMCILNILLWESWKIIHSHHSLSSDKSQKELWILKRKRRGRPCWRGEKYSVIILNKSMAARLRIKMGDGCFFSGQEGTILLTTLGL